MALFMRKIGHKMPRYEYVCNKCKTKFEIVATFDTILFMKPSCPNCKSEKVKKIISLPVIIYKGNGFYKTDKRT